MDALAQRLADAPDWWFPVLVVIGVQLVEALIDTFWPRKDKED